MKKIHIILLTITILFASLQIGIGQPCWADLRQDLTISGSGAQLVVNQELLDYFKSITPKEDRLKAWSKVKHLPYAFRTNVDNLKYINDILSSNLSRLEKTNLIESKITNSIYEHGAILDSDGSLLAFRVGGETSINFYDLYGTIPEGKYFTHNHPASGTFSDGDILTNSDFKFSEFSAVTKSGKKYTIKRTSNSVSITPVPLDQARTTYRSQLQTEYANQWNQTTPGSPERNALIIEINEELDRRTLNHFGFDYIKN